MTMTPEQIEETVLREAARLGIADIEAGRYETFTAEGLRRYVMELGESIAREHDEREK